MGGERGWVGLVGRGEGVGGVSGEGEGEVVLSVW